MNQDIFNKKKTSINCRGKLISTEKPLVMGILNITQDSFFDGGKYLTEKEWLAHTAHMLEDGAKMIDIGGVSTRPGSASVNEKDELTNILKVLIFVRKHFPQTIISIDTFRSNVARAAVDNGADIINDISGGTMDKKMFVTIAELKVPYVLMHIQGTPENMQKNPTYADVVKSIIHFLSEKVNELHQLGVNDIIIDPGFGFGKTLEHNYEILNKLDYLNLFDLPLLVGFSRKSMICKALHVKPENALNGTTVLNTIALLKGAKILRVHDVKQAVETVKIYELMNQSN